MKNTLIACVGLSLAVGLNSLAELPDARPERAGIIQSLNPDGSGTLRDGDSGDLLDFTGNGVNLWGAFVSGTPVVFVQIRTPHKVIRIVKEIKS